MERAFRAHGVFEAWIGDVAPRFAKNPDAPTYEKLLRVS
jgi:hypothetical protein